MKSIGKSSGIIRDFRLTIPSRCAYSFNREISARYRIVFVMWADLLPSGWRDIGDEGERAEFYVGLTRAEDKLIISHSRRSRFLEEVQGKLAALAVCE